MNSVHVPILLEPIVSALVETLPNRPGPAGVLVDCTFGGGGHSRAILERLPTPHRLIAFDQDLSAIERGRERFAEEIQSGRLTLVHSPFSEAASALKGLRVLGLMADLGFSSDQIEDPSRGLSFLRDGPLDMRLDQTRGESCSQLLSRLSEREIADILYELGEERLSRRIASLIVKKRSQGELPRTTAALAQLVSQAFPPAARHGRIHPATRTFQALRIYVNGELEELDCLLKRVIMEVEEGGRVAILSFHSLEDRKVKETFKDKTGPWKQIHKKPIEADEDEVRANPRSRSAKLRIAERVKGDDHAS